MQVLLLIAWLSAFRKPQKHLPVSTNLQTTSSELLLYYLRTLSVTHFLFVGAHRGIPNELMRQNSQAVPVDPHLLPEPDVAVPRV